MDTQVKPIWKEEYLNALFKGFLAVHELFEDTSIDFFFDKYPEKYAFLTGKQQENTGK